MATVSLLRVTGGMFVPMQEDDETVLNRVKNGDVISIEFKKVRNPRFLRKFFALINFAFECWEPEDQTSLKSKKRFREEITILAGHYDVVASLKGDVRAVAKSISFANMDEDEFEKLYDAVITVVLQKVLKTYSRADLDSVVENLLRFA